MSGGLSICLYMLYVSLLFHVCRYKQKSSWKYVVMARIWETPTQPKS